MSGEGVSAVPVDVLQTVPEAVLFDSEVGDAFFRANYGISFEESQQQVAAGKWQGTLGQMLVDPKCPVGPQVHEAYVNGAADGGQERAVEAVQGKLDSLKVLFPDFSADIGKRYEVKRELPQPLLEDDAAKKKLS